MIKIIIHPSLSESKTKSEERKHQIQNFKNHAAFHGMSTLKQYHHQNTRLPSDLLLHYQDVDFLQIIMVVDMASKLVLEVAP